MKDLIILGAGGAGEDIISLVNEINKTGEQWKIKGFLDDNPALLGKTKMGVKVLGPIEDCRKYLDAFFVSSIANPEERSIRRFIWEKAKSVEAKFAVLVHPSVVIYEGVSLGEGCVIQANCVLATRAQLYEDVHMAYGCNVAHETVIKEHVTLGSGVNLSSGVVINEDCYIGAGVSTAHDIEIEKDILVTVGSAVVTNLKNSQSQKWYGVPAISENQYIESLLSNKIVKQLRKKIYG